MTFQAASGFSLKMDLRLLVFVPLLCIFTLIIEIPRISYICETNLRPNTDTFRHVVFEN